MPLRISTGKPGLIWNGDFFAHHSLALVNRELTLALLGDASFRSRFELGIEPFGAQDFEPEPDGRLGPLVKRRAARPDDVRLTVRHHWPPNFTRPQSGKLILIQPWEFGSLPRFWVENIARSVDEIWVPSRFVRETYLTSGVPADKVFVVPNGVDTGRLHPGIAPFDFSSRPETAGIDPGSYKFLFVGGTIPRKGIDILLDAYDRAFSASSPVTLIVKDFGAESFYAGQDARALIQRLQAKPGGARIVHMTDNLSEEEIAGLYAACDCLVHPYRGEGYGLPIAEAMAVGKPTVVTGAGAALDFADESTSFLIPSRRVPLAEQRVGEWETVDRPYWNEADREALTAILRRIVDDPAEAERRGALAASRIAESHTWSHAAEAALARLDALIKTPAAAPIVPAPEGPAIEDACEQRKQSALRSTRAEDWERALPALTACLEERPDDWDLVNALAVARFRTGDVSQAVSLLRRGVAHAPNPRDFHHNLAFVLLKSGQPEEALDQALKALRISPDNADIRQTVALARDAIVKRARKLLRGSAGPSRAYAKRNPDYRRLVELQRAAEHLLNGIVDEEGARRHDDRPAAAAASGIAASEVRRASRPAGAEARISLVMIVKNEERFLRKCLESAAEIVDEMVIVDTGSTDSTIDIAREFGAVVISHPWNDDFSEARNVALEHATGDWALWLDADEEISAECRSRYRTIVRTAPPKVGGYMVEIRNWLQSPEPKPDSEMVVHHACRLFRCGPGVRFEGRIHEQNLRSLLALGYDYIRVEGISIDHYGYAGEIMTLRNKHERFITMLRREVEECPDPSFRTFHLFNLGNAYYTYGDMENAAVYLSQAAEDPDPAEEYTCATFTELATALQRLGRPAEGLEACDRAAAFGLHHSGISFARGYCLLHLGRYIEAEAAYRNAIDDRSSQESVYARTGDAGITSYKAQHGLALALVGQDRFSEALPLCRAALELQPGFVDARYLMAVCLVDAGRFDEARAEMETVLTHDPSHEEAQRRLAELLHGTGCFAEALTYLRALSQRFGDESNTLALFASCCEHLGQFREAGEAYRRLRWLMPGSAEICVNQGRALAAADEPAQAIDCFLEAIQLDPKNANAYFNAGDLLYQLGYYEKASESYLAGLQADPAHADGFFTLGNCYVQTGKPEAAILCYQQALTLDPSMDPARSNLELARDMAAGASQSRAA
jgi:tetratricopeptide (TPR) repeat protein